MHQVMNDRRPDIPRPLARAVKVEAGHRCAIPTCRATSGLQIHHIIEWAEVREHTFENLILLCANCHARVTAGEIDRRSVTVYKANLGLLVSRYGDLERRVIQRFVNQPVLNEVQIDTSHSILLEYLVNDGILTYLGAADGAFRFSVDDAPPEEEVSAADHYGPARWGLTDVGRQLIQRVRHATEIE
jgi:hypothetical protein